MFMRFRYAVSFESDSRPVETVRGELEKEAPDDALKSAVFQAFKSAPRGNYRSWVVCVEEVDANLDRSAG